MLSSTFCDYSQSAVYSQGGVCVLRTISIQSGIITTHYTNHSSIQAFSGCYRDDNLMSLCLSGTIKMTLYFMHYKSHY